MFHLVSLSFANFPGGGAVVLCLLGGVFGFLVCVLVWLVVFWPPGEFLPLIRFHLLKIPVVDRPCLVLDRQCRKKNTRVKEPGVRD